MNKCNLSILGLNLWIYGFFDRFLWKELFLSLLLCDVLFLEQKFVYRGKVSKTLYLLPLRVCLPHFPRELVHLFALQNDFNKVRTMNLWKNLKSSQNSVVSPSSFGCGCSTSLAGSSGLASSTIFFRGKPWVNMTMHTSKAIVNLNILILNRIEDNFQKKVESKTSYNLENDSTYMFTARLRPSVWRVGF